MQRRTAAKSRQLRVDLVQARTWLSCSKGVIMAVTVATRTYAQPDIINKLNKSM
jgi:hypothetical protein